MTQLSVLVTGASTGIGRAIALDLAAEGHQVFATVRKEADAQELENENPSVKALIADVTSDSQIAQAFEEVSRLREKNWPFCIVNNAGIAVAGPIEDLPLEQWQKQFDVNVIGLVRVTQKFLPLIRESRGRVINMSSVSGLVASPFLAPYSASKFAVEAISDSLRREVAGFGVKVVIIEPGAIQTPIWEKGLKQDIQVMEEYRQAIEVFAKAIEKTAQQALPVERVTEAVRQALTAVNPAARIVVAALPVKLAVRVSSALPARLTDAMLTLGIFGRKSQT